MAQLAYDICAGRAAPNRIFVNELIVQTARNILRLNGEYDSSLRLRNHCRESTPGKHPERTTVPADVGPSWTFLSAGAYDFTASPRI